MDNYFILSSKVGDKWAKVAPNMTSAKLGACIHMVGDLVHFVHDSFHQSAIAEAFTHIVSYPRYLHVIVHEPVSIAIPVCVPG
jgi:hypothetical protein